MHKPVVAFLLCLVSFTGMAQKIKQSLLWEVTGNNLTRPSYLFGTFHLICKEDFTITPGLTNAIRRCEQFYGEIDLSTPGWQQEMTSQMVMKGNTIETLMGSADYQKAGVSFKQITGMELQLFNTFKPFMGMSMITMFTIPCSNKIQPETEFIKIAQEQKIPVRGLETVSDQMAAIDAQPLSIQISSLKQALFNFDSVKIAMKEMIDIYKINDSDSLYRFIRNNLGDDVSENALIAERNKKWIPVITKAIMDKPGFFAFGAAHLGGETGVVELLRKLGYTLTPISY